MASSSSIFRTRIPIYLRSRPLRVPVAPQSPILSSQSIRLKSGPGFDRPAPPQLPPEQQKEFERLIKKANAPLSFTSSTVEVNKDLESRLDDSSDADVLHPDLRKKPLPEFKGDRNPVTGEVGGPKIEPLKHGDWSYGGRATDF